MLGSQLLRYPNREHEQYENGNKNRLEILQLITRKFNHLHCGERGLFIPLALGQVFLNCPLPTHLQLTYNRFWGKITRLKVYKSDLFTYSGVQIRPSHVFTFYTHACIKRRSSFPSGSSGGHGPEGSINERSVVTFVPEGDPLTRRSWPSSLCFWVTIRHLRLPEGEIIHSPKVLVFELVLLSDHLSPSAARRWYPSWHRRFWSLCLCFWVSLYN